jgi:hypothetical protein
MIRTGALRSIVPALALAVVSACGGTTPQPSSSTSSADDPAPYPFTAAEIRAGCPLGRVIDYRIEKVGESARSERWAFAPVGEDSVTITTTALDAQGNPTGVPETQTAKWTELHEHAHFPRAATQLSEESLTVPAGTFAVLRYVVTKEDDVKTLWFAKTLAGPPVKLEATHSGQTVMTMTMQANRMPKQ